MGRAVKRIAKEIKSDPDAFAASLDEAGSG